MSQRAELPAARSRLQPTRYQLLLVSSLFTLLGMVGGCGGSDGVSAAQTSGAAISPSIELPSDGSDIQDIESWCATFGQVDDLLTGDVGSDDFATAQRSAARAQAMLQQLADAADLVDVEHREAVLAEINFGLAFTGAYAAATNLDEVQRDLGQLANEAAGGADGPAWIEDTCGVDITD